MRERGTATPPSVPPPSSEKLVTTAGSRPDGGLTFPSVSVASRKLKDGVKPQTTVQPTLP